MDADDKKSTEGIEEIDTFGKVMLGLFLSLSLLTLGLFTFFLVHLLGDRIGVWQSGVIGFVIAVITLWAVVATNSGSLLESLISLVITLFAASMLFYSFSNAKVVGDKKRRQNAIQKSVPLVQSRNQQTYRKLAV